MGIRPDRIAQNVDRVRSRIEKACCSVERDPSSVTLIAACKNRTDEEARSVIQSGVNNLAENRVDALLRRIESINDPNVQWHFIGALQSNKASRLPVGVLVHGLCSESGARALNNAALAREVAQEVLVEVNVSGEKSKSGLNPSDLDSFITFTSTLERLRIRGLMFVAQMAEKAEDVRWMFTRLRVLAEQAGLQELSMGMSDDFEVAIQQGATMVRIGRTIFEEE